MKNKLQTIFTNPFIQGSTILTLGNFFISFLNYIFNLLAGRFLGPKGYGEITALFSYTLIFSIPFTIFSSLIIQKIGSQKNNQFAFINMLNDWFYSKLKRWSFLLLLLIIVSPWLPRLTNLSPFITYSLILMIILSLLTVLYSSIIQAMKFFLLSIGISIFSVLLKLTGIILVYFGIDGVNTIILFILLSSLSTLIISYLFIQKKIVNNILPSKKLNQRLITLLKEKYILITIFSILGITLLNNIDIIFVKKFFSPLNAGLYSAWALFAKIIFYLLGPLISVSYIFFTNSDKKNNQKNILIFSICLIIVLGLFAYIFYSIFPKIIINFFFGSQFSLLEKNLKSAAFFGMFYTLIMLINNFFLAKKSFISLVPILIMPFYIGCLFSFKQSIENIMSINIFFSFFTLFIYLIIILINQIQSRLLTL